MPKVGGKRKKTKTHKESDEDEDDQMVKVPKTFIIKRGKLNKPWKQTLYDMREVMYPYTAMKLKEGEKVKIQEYLKMAGIYKISHMMVFTSTENSNYLKMMKNPDGPTITFKVINYSNKEDFTAMKKNPKLYTRNFQPPLLIMNGFNDQNQNISIAAMLIQSMFPPINVAKTNISNVLFDYDQKNDVINFRHYNINQQQADLNKNVKKVLKMKKIPNLSDLNDISEFIKGKSQAISGYNSDSDGENLPDNQFENQDLKKKTSSTQTIKLDEIGPRIKLSLQKIEEGLMRGNILYHKIVQKSEKEILTQSFKMRQKLKKKELKSKLQTKIVNKKKHDQAVQKKVKLDDEFE